MVANPLMPNPPRLQSVGTKRPMWATPFRVSMVASQVQPLRMIETRQQTKGGSYKRWRSQGAARLSSLQRLAGQRRYPHPG